jgi:diaminopimelate epimerase
LRFTKYHALGNDYLVLETGAVPSADPIAELVRAVCDRHRGIGADGVLIEGWARDGRPCVRIVNPGGSEAETSGNGLRIFARYLFDRGRVGSERFEVLTAGGAVRCEVSDDGRAVLAELGRASFDSAAIPVAGPRRAVVDEELVVLGERRRFTAVTVGNPHCVILVDELSTELTLRLGPALESHPLFPRRTNVQFMRVLGRHRIAIEIWERGAGRTLASGSSSCAAAATAVRLGLCEGAVAVVMPGGELEVRVGTDFLVTLLGPVVQVATGALADELLHPRRAH